MSILGFRPVGPAGGLREGCLRTPPAARGAAAILLLALIQIPAFSADAKGKVTREYDLKAAFLFNFTQFVEWPAQAFSDANAPFAICILGEDPIGPSLDEILENEFVRNHRLVVRRYRSVEEINTCQILFISQSESSRLDQILGFLAGRSILTVGETEGFAARSGMIRFAVTANKLTLRINLEAAMAARLTISSKLLRLAEIVTPEETR